MALFPFAIQRCFPANANLGKALDFGYTRNILQAADSRIIDHPAQVQPSM